MYRTCWPVLVAGLCLTAIVTGPGAEDTAESERPVLNLAAPPVSPSNVQRLPRFLSTWSKNYKDGNDGNPRCFKLTTGPPVPTFHALGCLDLRSLAARIIREIMMLIPGMIEGLERNSAFYCEK